MVRYSIFAVILVFAFQIISKAQSVVPIELQKLSGEIILDGKVDEKYWDEIEPIKLKMLYPHFEGELTEYTEIRVAYDNDFIWASIRAYDGEPDKIQFNSLYRDREAGDDKFVLILDTFNSNETAMEFTVTPAGTRIDRLILNDSEPGRGPVGNKDWNTFWDAQATITQEGWFAEMQIPFSSLRFESGAGEPVIMGLRTFRWIPRKGENQMYPLTSPNDASNPWMKPSLAQDVKLEGITSSNPLYITPYILVGGTFDNNLNMASSEYDGVYDAQIDIGGDVKYGLSSNLTLDATIYTDFAQVEADDEQLNLGRFSLFFFPK